MSTYVKKKLQTSIPCDARGQKQLFFYSNFLQYTTLHFLGKDSSTLKVLKMYFFWGWAMIWNIACSIFNFKGPDNVNYPIKDSNKNCLA